MSGLIEGLLDRDRLGIACCTEFDAGGKRKLLDNWALMAIEGVYSRVLDGCSRRGVEASPVDSEASRLAFQRRLEFVTAAWLGAQMNAGEGTGNVLGDVIEKGLLLPSNGRKCVLSIGCDVLPAVAAPDLDMAGEVDEVGQIGGAAAGHEDETNAICFVERLQEVGYAGVRHGLHLVGVKRGQGSVVVEQQHGLGSECEPAES